MNTNEHRSELSAKARRGSAPVPSFEFRAARARASSGFGVPSSELEGRRRKAERGSRKAARGWRQFRVRGWAAAGDAQHGQADRATSNRRGSAFAKASATGWPLAGLRRTKGTDDTEVVPPGYRAAGPAGPNPKRWRSGRSPLPEAGVSFFHYTKLNQRNEGAMKCHA